MRFLPICFFLVLLYCGRCYKTRLSGNSSKAVSDTKAQNVADGGVIRKRGRDHQKVAVAKESDVDKFLVRGPRPGHERVNSFADLSSNSSGGSATDTMKDEEFFESATTTEPPAAWYQGGYGLTVAILVVLIGLGGLAGICMMM
eukprot:TRINITY_DN42651_c0_g1_i1.p1 TRINITY_DN42651_c0_g1~~TRINITY_DN42651_c0_g1_i1.p1  ORF type:complete len:163 (-),score=7.59 TRINITY_DN42651_c0_g1_i1:97-528(-)